MAAAKIVISRSIEQTGIRKNLLEDLALKIIYLVGEISLNELARQMGLSHKIVEELFGRLRKDQLCQVTGMTGGTHRVVASSGGKSRALELLAQNQYVGPAPVSLEDYVDRIRAQSVLDNRITPEDVTRAFEDLVLDSKTLHQLGVAATSGRGIFLYGPTGTGKTTIAETLTRLFDQDPVWVPYAVEVDGQIITVYDPVLHQRLEQTADPEQDGRWVRCRRPRMMVGGELTIEMLDLQFNSSTRFYTGPVQMKSNNGVLIIDDFGRQRVSPEELLNRWVVPLDRRIDFITLAGGRKIEIPFDLLVVFATNLDPAKLVDEAFLRRIQTKIKIDFMTPDQFREIFRRLCETARAPLRGGPGRRPDPDDRTGIQGTPAGLLPAGHPAAGPLDGPVPAEKARARPQGPRACLQQLFPGALAASPGGQRHSGAPCLSLTGV